MGVEGERESGRKREEEGREGGKRSGRELRRGARPLILLGSLGQVTESGRARPVDLFQASGGGGYF